jgi:L-fucose isomerase
MDMNPLIPKAVWGFNGTERPGAVYLASVLAAHAQKGLPAFGIYGRDVQDVSDKEIPSDVKAKLLQFARAGLAMATMRGTSYLSMGGVSMGIAGSQIDQQFFEQYLGMRHESIDQVEFIRRIDLGIYDPVEYEKALAWVKLNCKEGPDINPVEKQRTRAQKDSDWEFSVKAALITRDLMVGNSRLTELGWPEEARGHNALASGFQGQRQFTDFLPNGDFWEAISNTSFDWNGVRQPYVVATENDALNGISMLLGHLLTGTAQLFSDVRTFWSADAVKRVTGHTLTGRASGGFIHLINSGPSALDWTGRETVDGTPCIKPWWEVNLEDAGQCLDNTRWCTSSLGYFRGGGYSSNFLTRGEMPVTMSRINLVRGLGPVLQIAEGYVVSLPDEVNAKIDARTDPTWPTTWFVPITTGEGPFADVYSVMNNWGANHGAICYGHVGGDLITLASILRIPVDMHNVPANRVLRPAAWSRFGAQDPQGADFRACATYGPTYK